ncbi:MAG: hypothetical protein JNK57_04605 [Planctomycetaceae bacterium]|jgi:Na+-transporting NADH:ubiquinone oxidoreductase subunit NqrC|nr:hypothetical protein [Planctomycetaceae bacterium]
MSASKIIITVIATLTAVVSLTMVTGVAGFAALVMLGQRQYGLRLDHKNIEVYYTSEVTEAEATRFLTYLKENHGNTDKRITFQLDRTTEEFLVRMCAQEFVYTTNQLDDQLQALRDEIQAKCFVQEKVVFEACDDKLNTKKTWRSKELQAGK